MLEIGPNLQETIMTVIIVLAVITILGWLFKNI